MYGLPRPTCAAEFDDQEIILHVFEVFHHVLEHQSRLTDSTERHDGLFHCYFQTGLYILPFSFDQRSTINPQTF